MAPYKYIFRRHQIDTIHSKFEWKVNNVSIQIWLAIPTNVWWLLLRFFCSTSKYFVLDLWYYRMHLALFLARISWWTWSLFNLSNDTAIWYLFAYCSPSLVFLELVISSQSFCQLFLCMFNVLRHVARLIFA